MVHVFYRTVFKYSVQFGFKVACFSGKCCTLIFCQTGIQQSFINNQKFSAIDQFDQFFRLIINYLKCVTNKIKLLLLKCIGYFNTVMVKLHPKYNEKAVMIPTQNKVPSKSRGQRRPCLLAFRIISS